MSIPSSIMNMSSVEQFFVREKVETRKWLLDSMDSMLDSVFSQLSSKFVDCFNVPLGQQLDPMVSIDQISLLDQMNPSTGHVQQPAPFQQQTLFIDQNMMNASSSSYHQLFNNSQLVTSNNDLSTVSIKQEINDNHEYEFEEEDCDCDDCINGGIHQFKEEDILDDGDDDATTIIDDDEDIIESNVVSRTRKRQKVEDKEPVPVLITLSLRCLQSDCDLMFDTKEQLNAHLLNQHQVALFRCLFKDCRESFDTRPDLSKHIKSLHSDVSFWQCGACPKQFRSYAHLTQHNANYHQLGYYVCSAAGCGFSAPNRGKIHTHHQQQHKQGFRCHFSNCSYQNKDAARVKDHERKHLGVKPYRCRWPGCGYARSVRDTTMRYQEGSFWCGFECSGRSEGIFGGGEGVDVKVDGGIMHHTNTTQLLDYDNESLNDTTTRPLKRLQIQGESENPVEDPQEDQDPNPEDETQFPFVDVDEDLDSQQGILITLSLKYLQERVSRNVSQHVRSQS